jgi:hypothetical protein
MLSMLLGYDDDGNVVATLDYMVARDDAGRVIGLVDFSAHEAAGGELLDIWVAHRASGSKVWPEWIGSAAHAFRVELEGDPGRKRIGALVHKTSGHRRERAPIEEEIKRRLERSRREVVSLRNAMRKHLRAEGASDPEADELAARVDPAPVDLRDLLGGPDRPLQLDDRGRTRRKLPPKGTPSHLPMMGSRRPPT